MAHLQNLKLPELSAIKAERCRRSFYYFVQEFWDVIIRETPVWNWHIEYLCNELQAVAERIKRREPSEYDLVINIPPNSSKSTIVSQMLPVWCWVIDDTMRLLTGAYADTLATRDSVTSRDIIRSDKFRAYFPHIKIKSDGDNKTEYSTQNTGFRYATSTGGTIVGRHGHLIIIDDPMNPKESPSSVKVESANAWVDYVTTTRKIDNKITACILVMQRLHEKDPAGHMLKNKARTIKHICLPATVSNQVNPPELAEKYVDGLLDAVRLSHKELAVKKSVLGSYSYSGQYDQNPAPAEGGIIKKAWFMRYELEELISKAKATSQQLIWNFTVDGAYTANPNNDQSAILAYTFFENNLYVRNCVGVWEEMPDFIKTLYTFVNKNGYTSSSSVFVEPKATGLSVVQTLRRETILNMIIDKAPNQDKEIRVRAITPVLEARRVYVTNEPWADSLIEQCGMFPNAALKDKVDCLVMAINRSANSNTGTIDVSFN